MSWLRRFIALLCMEWERSKEPIRFIEHPLKPRSDSVLKVVFLDSCEITISGYYKRYTRHYAAWWAYPKTYVMFYVHGVIVQPDAPDYLREMVRTPVILPRMLPWFVPDITQLRFAMRSYIDIISARSKHKP